MGKRKIEDSHTKTGESEEQTSVAKEPFKTQDEYSTYFKETNKELSNLKKNLSSLQKSNEEILKSFSKKLDDVQGKGIETLAIFVALFTFVSVDIQVFKTSVSTLSAMGFTLVMLGALLLFVTVLLYLFDEEEKKKWTLFLFFGASVVLIVVGILAVGHEYQGVEKTLKDNFYSREEVNFLVASSTSEAIGAFKKCIVQNQSYWPCLK